jgi:5-methylthioadenosine/S-adenosylhomocysteine deaminase
MSATRRSVIRSGRILDIERMDAPERDVLIEGNRIIAIEEPGVVVSGDYREIDASDRLLIPGLINTHTHGHGSLGRGRGDRWSLELLLNAGPWISGKRTLGDKRLSAQLNAAEMVLKGCTACYDLYFEFPTPTSEGINEVAGGYADVGTRAVVAPMVADRSLYDAIPGLLDALPEPHRSNAEKIRLAPASVALDAYEELLSGWSHDRDRARPAIAPTIPQHCSDDFLRACRALADDHGAGIHMHLSESKAQALMGHEIYGKTQTSHLHDLGLLGPDFVGAHCIWLTDDDIELIADAGAGITHQPSCNLRVGSGIAPVRKFLEAGIPVGIGTDGSNASDHQNMFDALRSAANVSRILDADYRRWISAQESLTMGTIGGARLLGFEGRLGRIAPGYLADIVFLDLGSINFIPLNNPVHQIVNCEDSTSVDSVMIDGKLVLKNREFTGFRFDELRGKVEAAIKRLDETTLEEKALAEKLEPIVGSFCIGLQKTPHAVQRTLYCSCRE